MRDPLATVPRSARLCDYFGLWSIEPTAATALAEQLARCDPAALSARAPAPASTVELIPVKGDKRVAVVRIVGEMMKGQSWFGGTSTVQVRRDIQSAAADPNTSGILLAIDSPGGSVAGTADLAAEVKAARRKKPVWAHVDDVTASAAYHVASQADQVWANTADAMVGSIGTLWMIADTSGLADKAGVKVHAIATGPLKAAGRFGTAVTDGHLAYFQALVDSSQAHFDAAVRTGRRLTAEQMAEVRSGAIYPAARAKELRLIDGIRPLGQTIAALAAAG
jgi:signal peptide peptidase SppA